MSLPGARRREPLSRATGMNFTQFHDRVKNMPTLQGGASGWNRLPVVNRCATLIAHRLASMPLRVVNDDGEEVEPPQWLEHPTGTWTSTDLVTAAVWSLLMVGNFYVIPLRDPMGEVGAVDVPDPGKVTMRPVAGESGGYEYFIAGKHWTGGLVHARYATLPSSPLGYSAIAAAASNVQIAVNAQGYRLQLLEKGLATQYVITSKEAMAPGAAEDLTAQIEERHAGPSNAFRPMILEELDLKSISMTAQEADLQSLVMYNDAQIAAQVFGVDPTMVGIHPEGSSLTYHERPGPGYRLLAGHPPAHRCAPGGLVLGAHARGGQRGHGREADADGLHARPLRPGGVAVCQRDRHAERDAGDGRAGSRAGR